MIKRILEIFGCYLMNSSFDSRAITAGQELHPALKNVLSNFIRSVFRCKENLRNTLYYIKINITTGKLHFKIDNIEGDDNDKNYVRMSG